MSIAVVVLCYLLSSLGVLVLVALGTDLWLWWEGLPTISAFLRQEPLWFVLPAALLLSSLVLLALHLKLTPRYFP